MLRKGIGGWYLALAIALVSRWVCAAMACAKCVVGENLSKLPAWVFEAVHVIVHRYGVLGGCLPFYCFSVSR